MKHFAGDVTYSVIGWLDKNNDKLSDDYEKHLTQSSKALIKEHLVKQEPEDGGGGKGGKGGGRGRPKAAQTVGRSFLASLKKLLDALESTEAHFIRCIKPNNELKPNLLYGAFVLTQLKCSGTLGGVELMQRGYPSRIPYSAIHERLQGLHAAVCAGAAAERVRRGDRARMGRAARGLQLGMYKIFMRAARPPS